MSGIELFRVKSVAPKLRGCENVQLIWFYDTPRKTPITSYALAVSGYKPGNYYARDLVDEHFSAEEADWLYAWLTENSLGISDRMVTNAH